MPTSDAARGRTLARVKRYLRLTQTWEARSAPQDRRLPAPLSNPAPFLPNNEARSLVGRHKAASCGADDEDNGLPSGMPPRRAAYPQPAPAPRKRPAQQTDD